jgi:hypothetical protein
MQGYRFTVLRVVKRHPKLVLAEKLHPQARKEKKRRQ